MDSFLWLLSSALNLIHRALIFTSSIIWTYKFHLVLLFIFYSLLLCNLCWGSVFSKNFKYLHTCSLKWCYDGCIKPLTSLPSHCWYVLVAFCIEIVIFLDLDTSDFRLKSEQFVYSVMRLWTFFKPYMLLRFHDMASARKVRTITLLLPGRGRNPDSSLVFFWQWGQRLSVGPEVPCHSFRSPLITPWKKGVGIPSLLLPVCPPLTQRKHVSMPLGWGKNSPLRSPQQAVGGMTQYSQMGMEAVAPPSSPQILWRGVHHYHLAEMKVPAPYLTSATTTAGGLENLITVWGQRGLPTQPLLAQSGNGARLFLWYLARVEQLLSKRFLARNLSRTLSWSFG